MWSRNFFIYLVTAQLVLVATLLAYVNQYKVKTIISLVPNGSLIVSSHTGFSSFYEPQPGYVDAQLPPWPVTPFTIKINSDTLNAIGDYKAKKMERTYRIAVLGDSSTYGVYVSTPRNYPSRLEQLLNNDVTCKNYDTFEVINGGVRGYDLQYEAERYVVRIHKYNPDLLIWTVNIGDFEQPVEEATREFTRIEVATSGPELIEAWKRAYMYTDTLPTSYIRSINTAALKKVRDAHSGSIVLYSLATKLASGKRPDLEVRATVEGVASMRTNFFTYESPVSIHGINAFPDQHPSAQGHEAIARDLEQHLLTTVLKGECHAR